jgi:biotin carboxyl carrier protein
VKAPIPGQIAQVLVTAGQPVKAGQTLIILEAMKMRNEIRSQAAGTVSVVHVAAGQTIARGDLLVEIE